MSAEQMLEAVLEADQGFQALAGDRIFPDVIPQKERLPAAAYSRQATEYVQTIHAASAIGETVTLDVSCVAESRAEADELADAVTDTLSSNGFVILGRQGAFDLETELYASIVTASVNE